MHVYSVGVSEQLSAVILTLIVLSSMSLLFIYANNFISITEQRISRRIIEAGASVKQALDIAAAYISGDELVIVIASNNYPVKLYDIYVNESLATSYCNINGEAIEGHVVEPLYLEVITCSMGLTNFTLIKLVYEGGVIEAYASRIQ
ncbi:MAG: hypothetical protein RMI83_02005 [Desulfurococcaceae archaeon]|nr:hypothetical protein [Sulfolobales archaeon]MDW8169862.1 hypothetical protein [Desulfurococcaceae archaeon]